MKRRTCQYCRCPFGGFWAWLLRFHTCDHCVHRMADWGLPPRTPEHCAQYREANQK